MTASINRHFIVVLAAAAVAFAISLYSHSSPDQADVMSDQSPREERATESEKESSAGNYVDASGIHALEEHQSISTADPLTTKIFKLYGASTIDDLDTFATAAGQRLVLDAAELRWQAESFCNLLHDVALIENDRPMVGFVEKYGHGKTVKAITSARWLDQRRSLYCTRGVDINEDALGAASYDSVLSAGTDTFDAAGLTAAQQTMDMVSEFEKIPQDEMPPTEIAKMTERIDAARTALLDVIATTESPAAFRRAADLMSDGSVLAGGWYPDGVKAQARWFNESESSWRLAGVQLAFCRMVGPGCGPNSLALIHSCMPGNCRPGESVADFLRRTNSPQAMEAAQAYADALLAMRRGKP